jgi:hypothetical protein
MILMRGRHLNSSLCGSAATVQRNATDGSEPSRIVTDGRNYFGEGTAMMGKAKRLAVRSNGQNREANKAAAI